MADEEFGLELVDAEGDEPTGEALAELRLRFARGGPCPVYEQTLTLSPV